MRRVVVLGVPGSGKTTLAQALAERFGIPHVELDSWNHGPNWTPAPRDEFRGRVAALTEQPAWVVDGNYLDLAGPLLWHRAEVVVWLDLPLGRVVLPRLARRSLTRLLRRTELWHGNRETLRTLLFSRDSLLYWTFVAHRRHARELPLRLAPPALAGPSVVRLRSSREVTAWRSAVLAPAGPRDPADTPPEPPVSGAPRGAPS